MFIQFVHKMASIGHQKILQIAIGAKFHYDHQLAFDQIFGTGSQETHNVHVKAQVDENFEL